MCADIKRQSNTFHVSRHDFFKNKRWQWRQKQQQQQQQRTDHRTESRNNLWFFFLNFEIDGWHTYGTQEIPYVMMHYGKNLTGNERFFGFCVDILARVAKEVGFDYILDLVPDKKYGACDPTTGEWNGMVLQLMKQVSIFIWITKTGGSKKRY